METPKTPYGLEEHLSTLCQQAPQFKNLHSSWELNKRSCASALKQVAQNYPHYSVHDELHSQNVVSNMEQLLGEDRLCKLSPTDTWRLLQLAYLHDFGMLLLYDNIEQEWESADFQEYLRECRDSNNPSIKTAADYLYNLKENLSRADFEKTWPLHIRRYTTYLIAGYYRGKHAGLTNQYITGRLDRWGVDLSHNGLIQPRLIKLLGQLSLLHTRNQEEVLHLDYISNGYAADYIHPRFLAEMLRLGDLLDADNSRFEPTAELVTGELPQDSAAHKGKHEATIHLLITPEQIEYRADCPNHAVYRETRVFLDWLESELTFAAINWLSLIPKELGGTAPRLTKKELLLNGKPDIENTSDLRFGISQEKAFQIIEGSGIYNDKMIFLRELIQNAEDASKIQLWRDLQKRPDLYLVDNADKNDLSHLQPYDIKSEAFDSYKITVDMRQEPDEKFRIRIIDRGTGMSVDTVKQMCRVGTSYHQDKARRREIEAMPAWLRPTAGFGIGLQSVFLVAPVFTIYSRTEESAIKVTVESRKKEGYVQIEKGEFWEEQGTCVEVILDKEQIPDANDSLFNNDFFDVNYSDKTLNLKYEKIFRTVESHENSAFFPIELTREAVLSRELAKTDWYRFQTEKCQRSASLRIVRSENGGLDIWDTKAYTLLHVVWCPVPKGEFSFKGKRIEKDDSLYAYEDNISLDFDFYGLDAKNYLSVNRQEFKADKKDEIEKQVCVITKEVVDYLLTLDDICEPLEDKLYFPLGGSDIFDFYLNLWQIADENQEKLMMGSPKKCLEPMSTKVKTLCWSQGKQYELKETKVGEIIENYKNFNYMYHDFNRGFSDIAYAYCCKIANTIAKEVNFQELVLFGHHSDINIPGTYISQIWLFPKADGILAYSLDNAPAEYFEMSEESKARYLKALYYGQNFGGTNDLPRRYAIPALKDYSELTLRSSDVPVGFLINDTRIDAWTISPSCPWTSL